MKQVLQRLDTGDIVVADVPDPVAQPGCVLVRTAASVISAGTEGAQVAQAARSLLQRVREKPQLLRKGLATLRAGGVAALRSQIAGKFSGFTALGYSCAGTVLAAGEGVTLFRPGQRVACAGIGYASHAELVAVPANLCAAVPDGVSDEAAAYATLGAIALQGVRQAEAAVGETVVVIGLGLVGLLSAQILRAAGCTVVGVDPQPDACRRGLEHGCAATVPPAAAADAVRAASRGLGADAVIICAAAADSRPVELAGELARSRGRVVMVGATGMELPRPLYFAKELTFKLSRSYGPGRYDPTYEEMGLDYPADYVRFTEQRNLQSVLDLAAGGRLDPARLTTHRFALADAPQAYALLRDPAAPRVGLVLTYPQAPAPAPRIAFAAAAPRAGAPRLRAGVIGAGGYATGAILPLLRGRPGVELRGVAATRPDHAASAAQRFGFAYAAARVEEILDDADTDAVFLLTRHDSHADLTVRALAAGKHVWVEKPLALTLEELQRVEAALRAHPQAVLTVGFNRRFSPLTAWLRGAWAAPGPALMSYRVNAGLLPAGHWTEDPAVGGGRLLGEGCHFFDFLCAWCGAAPVRVTVEAVRATQPAASNFTASIAFADGSVGQLAYSAQGSPHLPKERLEIFAGSSCAVLDDFSSAVLATAAGRRTHTLPAQDKGQAGLLAGFCAALQTGAPPPIAREALLQSTRLTLAAQLSLEQQKPVELASLNPTPDT